VREVVAYAPAAFAPAAQSFIDLVSTLDVGLVRPVTGNWTGN
jgi:hypothetical protein